MKAVFWLQLIKLKFSEKYINTFKHKSAHISKYSHVTTLTIYYIIILYNVSVARPRRVLRRHSNIYLYII